MTKLDTALRGVTRLGLDTAPIIYFVEANPQYDALVSEIMLRIVNLKFEGITSVITLLEVLVIPLRANNLILQQEYRDLLQNSSHFQTLETTVDIAEIAADLRAR